MGEGASAVLGFAVGVAISPVPIIAVILMLFSRRARVNGPLFLLGWVFSLAVISGAAYAMADQGDAATDETTVDAVAWGKLVFGLLFLLLAVRSWRNRTMPGSDPDTPKWMAGIDDLTAGKALGLGALLAGVNPKNLMLSLAAGAALAQLSLTTSGAVWSLVLFVVVASLTIALPVGYYLVGGASARQRLDDLKEWLILHNSAVMTVLFLVLGVDLIATALPPLT
jgi:hypothetical protein